MRMRTRSDKEQGRPLAGEEDAPQRQYRFRYELLWVPLIVLLAMSVLEHLRLVMVPWEQLMDALHVVHRERYTQLGVLGVLLIGGLLVLKTLIESDEAT